MWFSSGLLAAYYGTDWPGITALLAVENGYMHTLSRFISDERISPSSKIEWSAPEHEKVVVYNRDFIEHNFSEDKALPGIFTLGSESIEIQNEIEELRNQQNRAKERKDGENKTLKNIIDSLAELKAKTKEKCWEIQAKYGSEFADALVGYRASKDKFFEKCISVYLEIRNDNTSMPPTLDQIQDTFRSAYAKGAEIVDEYKKIDKSHIDDIDNQELLSKNITGKANTPIGTFIQFLKSSDWVKQGIEYRKKAGGKCPFCQRDIPDDIAKQIEDFFDEEYEKDCAALARYQKQYLTFCGIVRTALDQIKSEKYDFLQYEEFEQLANQFSTTAQQNVAAIQTKIDSPSKTIEIKPVRIIIEKINLLIDEYNKKIQNNNAIIVEKNKAKKNCQILICHFFVEEIKETLSKYEKDLTGKNNGIRKIESNIKTFDNSITDLENQISKKEASLTSVIPTVTAINKILEGFGFIGFSIAENPDKPGTYLIVRPDGSDASKTLSEGEHNFISFLYFYHLCFGSQSNTGLAKNKILVIDDPISSLDSNVLFVIATLVKSIIQNCREKEKGIKQVFILTHNVYFHKEVTYLGSRDKFKQDEVLYFIIRKKDENSCIVTYQDNPIKSTYEILWDELRHPNESSIKSVFNTMRRILEHYFQVIGGIKYEECINQFNGEDKLICKALIAFINDGSHSIFDELVVSIDETSLQNYLRVFKLIFERLHHIDHYNMMMGITEETA